jgi:hypothetical protein
MGKIGERFVEFLPFLAPLVIVAAGAARFALRDYAGLLILAPALVRLYQITADTRPADLLHVFYWTWVLFFVALVAPLAVRVVMIYRHREICAFRRASRLRGSFRARKQLTERSANPH